MTAATPQAVRRPGPGFAVIAVVGALAFTMLAVPLLLRAFEPDNQATLDAIDTARRDMPLIDTDWQADVDVPFGTVDLPGEHRSVEVSADFWPAVDATVVGSNGNALAVAELPHEADFGDDVKVGFQGATALALSDELGVDLSKFKALGYPGGVIELETIIGSRYWEGGTLVADTTHDGTQLRLRVVRVGDREVLVVRVLPDGTEDVVTDRVAESVVMS